jgi:hypothetical protein
MQGYLTISCKEQGTEAQAEQGKVEVAAARPVIQVQDQMYQRKGKEKSKEKHQCRGYCS